MLNWLNVVENWRVNSTVTEEKSTDFDQQNFCFLISLYLLLKQKEMF